jgi:hypothetical protein
VRVRPSDLRRKSKGHQRSEKANIEVNKKIEETDNYYYYNDRKKLFFYIFLMYKQKTKISFLIFVARNFDFGTKPSLETKEKQKKSLEHEATPQLFRF